MGREKRGKSAQNGENAETVDGHNVLKRHDLRRLSYAPSVMHNKVIVCDDTVITGSYNFSRNGAGNAENVLLVHDAACAAAYAGYIDSLVAAYAPAS